jgi:hypothetical protein
MPFFGRRCRNGVANCGPHQQLPLRTRAMGHMPQNAIRCWRVMRVQPVGPVSCFGIFAVETVFRRGPFDLYTDALFW